MSLNAADGAALVAAAVQAAVREKAPRRTVAAVAAAVAGTVMSAATRPTPTATRATVPARDSPGAADDAEDPAQLLASLRAVKRAERKRKKERRKAARQAASEPTQPDLRSSSHAPTSSSQNMSMPDEQSGAVATTDGAAGPRAESGETLAAEPAPAPGTTAAPDDDISRSASISPVINEDALPRAAVTNGSCGPPSSVGTSVEPLGAARNLPREPGAASAGKPRPGPYATPAGKGSGKPHVQWKK